MKFELPVAICHGMVRNLIRANLLVPDRKVLTGQGKWQQLYRSNIRTDPSDAERFITRSEDARVSSDSFSVEDLYRVQEVLT